MADEQIEQQVPETQPEATNAQPQPVVVDGTPVKQEPKVAPEKDFASSNLPYHTAETEKIAKDRAKEQEGKDPEPYKYEANGYTVEEYEAANPQATKPEDANKMWRVTADGFEQAFNNQTAAEIFVRTHSPEFKNMPAGVPKT